jgi:small-conductance mechanosensitive channel
MAVARPAQPWRVLARDLLVAVVLAGLLYALFTIFNSRLLHGFTSAEVLLLEAGAVVLIAFLVAQALVGATSAVLARHGLAPRGHTIRLFLNLVIAAGAVLALFKLAGVSIESIFIGAGFAGIVLGLASQTVLSNVFAGILLVFADPFRPGDRVGLIASQYGMIAPSYPHEAAPPVYSGTVEDVGLNYTVLALDAGGIAKVPNGVVIQALVLLPARSSVQRVRMTFPATTPPSSVETSLPDVAREFPPPFAGAPPPRMEVVDLSASSWDAVVVLWTDVRDASAVRDRVLRAVLGHLAPPAAA